MIINAFPCAFCHEKSNELLAAKFINFFVVAFKVSKNSNSYVQIARICNVQKYYFIYYHKDMKNINIYTFY